MDGLIACLWLVSGPFYGPFYGHSICHTWPQVSRMLLLGFE